MKKLHEEVPAQMLEAKVDKVPDRVIITFEYGLLGEERLTYRQLFERASQTAIWLKEKGVGKGDRVALFLRNYPEFLYAMLGSNMVGAIWVALDPRLVGESLVYQLRDSQSKVVFTTADLLLGLKQAEGFRGAVVYAVKPEMADPSEEDRQRLSRTNALTPLPEIFERPFTPVEQQGLPDDPSQIMYTSGTTGAPKGVLWRNRRLDGLVDLLWRYTSDDILYTGLSLSHANAHTVTLIPSLYREIPSVYSVRFTASRIWDICRKYNCTTFSCLGGMISMIYARPEKPDDREHPVRMVVSAGTPAAIWEAFEKRFQVKILEWYGALDGGCVTVKPIGQGPVGSMGKPLDFFQIRIIDEAGKDVPVGKPGELISRPVVGEPKVEYYGKEKESREKTLEGWHRSGDIVCQDEEGWLYFRHRKGEELRKYGEFIQPSLIEKIFCEHPGVRDVCVFGVPSKEGAPGESDVVAAIVSGTASAPDVKEWSAWGRNHLPKSHWPDFFQWVEEIPKTLSQRPLTRLLKSDFLEKKGRIYDVRAERWLAHP